MGDREIEELGGSPLVSSSQKNKLTEAETKRRKLEEDIRREKEERLKKRQELMMRENEYEQVSCVMLLLLCLLLALLVVVVLLSLLSISCCCCAHTKHFLTIYCRKYESESCKKRDSLLEKRLQQRKHMSLWRKIRRRGYLVLQLPSPVVTFMVHLRHQGG